ncbi:MAG: sodium:alanine symporter family protein [Nannocystaceae bacterium]
MTETLSAISDIVWGPWVLIPLLLLTGLYLTIRLRGLQFRELGHSLYLGLIVRREAGAEGDISHFQALMTALAATVGTGNIVGVATAIGLGGPGALFWMWMTGLVGMATKYSEALLSVKYRIQSPDGAYSGGPMYYLSRGIKGPTGRALGTSFALFGAIAAFGAGNMVQSNSMAAAIHASFGVPPWGSGLVITALAALVIVGGISSIGRFAGALVPTMIVVYMLACLVVLGLHAGEIPSAFSLVFEDAFTGTSAVGGFTGAAVAQAVRFGVARGIFSNESGLGSAGIAAAAAQTKEPTTQALVSMTQTFIDTLLVCTCTGLALIVTGAWRSDQEGALMTQLAFESAFGDAGGIIVTVSLVMFAFSTILGWSYYGEKCLGYLLGPRAILPYRILFIAAIFLGSWASLKFVWTLSDLTNGLMALPNLVGLLLLSGVIVSETNGYFKRRK